MHYPLITPNQLNSVGSGLSRPECVLAHSSGCVIVPNWTDGGGISWITPAGATHSVIQNDWSEPLKPNGIALDTDGNVVLAHLGDQRGGVFTLSPDGAVAVRVDTVEGSPIPPTNFVVHDSTGRLWITVSTRKTPRADDYRSHASTGFIAVAEPGNSDAKIVADRLGYTNEVVIDESRQSVYVNETFGRRLTRFDLQNDGTLGSSETVARFGEGTYPDGLALASDGSLWITSIVSNRVLVLHNDGSIQTLLEDISEDALSNTEEAFRTETLNASHLTTAHGAELKNISSLAFAGKDLQTACLGSLLGSQVMTFRAPVAGTPMVHWDAPISHWIEKFGD